VSHVVADPTTIAHSPAPPRPDPLLRLLAASKVMGSGIVNIDNTPNRHSWPLTLEYCAQLCDDLNKSIAGAEGGK
jgi:hypothetical protein